MISPKSIMSWDDSTLDWYKRTPGPNKANIRSSVFEMRISHVSLDSKGQEVGKPRKGIQTQKNLKQPQKAYHLLDGSHLSPPKNHNPKALPSTLPLALISSPSPPSIFRGPTLSTLLFSRADSEKIFYFIIVTNSLNPHFFDFKITEEDNKEKQGKKGKSSCGTLSRLWKSLCALVSSSINGSYNNAHLQKVVVSIK